MLVSVYGHENTLLPVVVQQRFGLIIVVCESALDRLGFVVFPLHQFAAAFIADTFDLWWIGLDVIDGSTAFARTSSTKPGDEFFTRDVDFDDCVEGDILA